MEYKGHKLTEIKTPQIMNPPEEMVVWDMQLKHVERMTVTAIVKDVHGDTWAIVHSKVHNIFDFWPHCAKLPEGLDRRRATNSELARWLTQGNGEVLTLVSDMHNRHCREMVTTAWHYFSGSDAEEVEYGFKWQRCKGIRKWGDPEWHDPTIDYMGIEDK